MDKKEILKSALEKAVNNIPDYEDVLVLERYTTYLANNCSEILGNELQSLQQENERLRGLVEALVKSKAATEAMLTGMELSKLEDYTNERWQTFKQQNNL